MSKSITKSIYIAPPLIDFTIFAYFSQISQRQIQLNEISIILAVLRRSL